VEQFLQFRRNHPFSRSAFSSVDCPVPDVSWYDAAAYCNWLSERDGLGRDQWCYEPNEKGEYAEGMKLAADYLQRTGYRLPTEAEWEYACRAGTETMFSMGEPADLIDKYAWHIGNSSYKSHPAGSLRPNDLGLFDMHGNLMEWTQDVYEGPPGKAEGDKPTSDIEDVTYIYPKHPRVMRGGSFLEPGWDVRSAENFRFNVPSVRHFFYGFRPARTITP